MPFAQSDFSHRCPWSTLGRDAPTLVRAGDARQDRGLGCGRRPRRCPIRLSGGRLDQNARQPRHHGFAIDNGDAKSNQLEIKADGGESGLSRTCALRDQLRVLLYFIQASGNREGHGALTIPFQPDLCRHDGDQWRPGWSSLAARRGASNMSIKPTSGRCRRGLRRSAARPWRPAKAGRALLGNQRRLRWRKLGESPDWLDLAHSHAVGRPRLNFLYRGQSAKWFAVSLYRQDG